MIRAKHRQALGLMREHGIETWLIQFARETGMRPDPLGYLVGGSVTWPSAFLLNQDGSTAAIVGSGDAGTFEATGLWTEVRGFRNGPGEDLHDVLGKWDPITIGVSTLLTSNAPSPSEPDTAINAPVDAISKL